MASSKQTKSEQHSLSGQPRLWPEKLLPYIFIFCFLGVYLYSFDAKLDLNGDNANYIHYAHNLAEGNGYSSFGVDGLVPTGQYPPAYSSFLALLMSIGIHSLVVFKVANGVLLLASLLLLFRMTSHLVENRYVAFVAVVLASFSPMLLHFAGMVMSEMMFVFFTVLSLWAMMHYADSDATKKPFWKNPYFYLISLSAVAAYHTRVVGMALIFATVVFFLARREWKQLLLSMCVIVSMSIPWAVRNHMHEIPSRYFGTIMTVNPWRPEQGGISSIGEMIRKMLQNFDETVLKGFKEILFPFATVEYTEPSSFGQIVAGFIFLAIILWGAYQFGKIRWAVLAYLIGQIGLFMLWHGGNGSRYVVPIAPLLFVCFYVGLYTFIRQASTRLSIGSKVLSYTPFPLIFLLIILPMRRSLQEQNQLIKMPYPAAYQHYFEIARLLEKEVPGAVCISRKPELFRYYAPSLRNGNYLYTLEGEDLVRDLIKKKADFVVLEQLGYASTYRYLYPAIEQYSQLFPVVWHLPNPDTYLLRFDRQKAMELFENSP